ncbi:palmitoyltransferase AKR1 [Suhomyces tanzawaensis NRRL Y-17324]|uniref:Palmitoyltransferase n=1 Tax=Suhomyces tanzawaensis NRRL Y-17324 TaxID=984487 RepID=A0A1E4SEN4_9ASCO|nr:palmitoyltransferase AKR1 [Suhomyces tanzawaensis NRRL Y-17324]ODV77981.1 palmitoyltransferase AKR1 [Suhomyces tanzawaensis NRRL Y-17324]
MARKNKKTSSEEKKSLLQNQEASQNTNPKSPEIAGSTNGPENTERKPDVENLGLNQPTDEELPSVNESHIQDGESDNVDLTTMAEEQSSIKSTDAVLEANKDDLSTVGRNEDQPTEQDLNPDLAKFMFACQEGNLTIVKDLISSKTVGANDTFSDGVTGLHWACINNRLSLVKYLTSNEYSKADPNQLGGDLKATPLHWACRNGLVYIVDYLLTNTNADPSIRDVQSYNSLHLAIHSSNIPLVTYLLLTCCTPHSTNPIYVDEPDGFNRTGLHWAAYQGDILTINTLLQFGADVTKVDNTLFIPLHWAFMKGYKYVLKVLLEAGSDIHAKNDQGKDSFEIAKDMNCVSTWNQVLAEDDRDASNNWAKRRKLMEPKLAKLITFFSPYVLLPVALRICSFSEGFFIPKLFFALVVFVGGIALVAKTIVPIYLVDDKALARSPILSGIFSATAFWAGSIWFFKILPLTFFRYFFSNILLGGVFALCIWSFFKSMFINPGYVPVPSDKTVTLNQVKDLIQIGKFDTDHFCFDSMVRKPLRSKYSRQSKKLVARFDHYCPWVYNDIGVRNHKLFMVFVYTLNLAILLFTRLSIGYFDKLSDGYDTDLEGECFLLSDELCYGYRNKHFHYNIVMWCLLQYVWVVFLGAVQTFQILKGLTTREFSTLNKRIERNKFNHATLPRDFTSDLNTENQSEGSPEAPTPSRSGHHHHGNNDFKMCIRLIGLDQFFMTIKLSLASLPFISSSAVTSNQAQDTFNSVNIPTDYGMKQNWFDFWVLGDITFRNVFYLPIEGENNLNGKTVDYYKLYEYPAKSEGELV